MSLNRCEFIGRLGADPEIRLSQSSKKIATFRIAVSEKRKDGEHTTWVPIVCFNDKLSGVIEQYLRKGSRVYVAGQFQVRKWQDQSGQDRYSTEVVMGFNGQLEMLDSKKEEPSGGGYQAPLDDSEIPF